MSVVINGSAGVTTNSGAVYNGIQAGTAVASTSGTSIDFTSIPSWVKRVTVMFTGVSTNSTGALEIRVGSGSVTASGYQSAASYGSGSGAQFINSTTGFALNPSGEQLATILLSGAYTLVLLGTNTWVGSACFSGGTTFNPLWAGGTSPALSGALDRVRITTVGGTDTFDAGSINILYE